jgi:uncharacterized protein GlcG (DUF336 family)
MPRLRKRWSPRGRLRRDGINVKLSCAIVDSRGDLIALGHMPGAGGGTTHTAIGKAIAVGHLRTAERGARWPRDADHPATTGPT